MSHRDQHHIAWVDHETLEAIDWLGYFRAFAPVSVYGQQVKYELKPYLPGCEGDAEQAWTQLKEDRRHITVALAESIRDQLARLPDIRDALETVSWSSAPLSPKHFLALKQFAVRGLRLARTEALHRSGWESPRLWLRLLETFTTTEDTENVSESFSLDELEFADVQSAVREVTNAIQRVAKEKREQQQLWEASTQSRMRHDGQLVVPLPSHRDLAEACKQDRRLRWLRDTPYESIFEVLPSPGLSAAQDQLEQARKALEEAERKALEELTSRVRNMQEQWRGRVEAVAELDCRIAKVKMLCDFDGCVPELGLSVGLREAIQPQVSHRLQAEGQHFTPVTLRPEDGTNILFGSNMGGKSVSLSLLVACQLLAQYGLPVPAKVFQTRLFSAIRFAATTGTDMTSGLSAYGAEVVRVSECWQAFASPGPVLAVFDEPVRSTNPLEGSALVTGLVRAALRQTFGTQSVVWVATHFADPLLEPAAAKFRVRGLKSTDEHGARSGADILHRLRQLEDTMDFRIERVDEVEFHPEALPVAEYLGAPDEWLNEARAFLREGRRS